MVARRADFPLEIIHEISLSGNNSDTGCGGFGVWHWLAVWFRFGDLFYECCTNVRADEIKQIGRPLAEIKQKTFSFYFTKLLRMYEQLYARKTGDNRYNVKC